MTDETLKQKALALRQAGATTPEICGALGLDLNAVLSLLLADQAQPILPPIAKSAPKPTPDNQRSDLLHQILTGLSEPASSYGYAGDLWTPHRLIAQFKLPRGTVYRWIERANLSFSHRLRWQFPDTASYQGWMTTVWPRLNAAAARHNALLYWLDELRPDDLPHSAQQIWSAAARCPQLQLGNPVLVCGISPAGRLAGQLHWCLRQVTVGQHLQFFQALLSLHPHRNLFILAKANRSYRSQRLQTFWQGQPRLHGFLL